MGIEVTAGYTGSTTDFLKALAVIPDNDSSFTSATLTGHTAAGIWNLQSGSGLNAGGCSGSGAPFVCVQANGAGSNLFNYNGSTFTPKTLIFQFTITGTPPSLGDTAHIKYLYTDDLGNKVGSLGSFDVGIQCIGGNGCDGSTVPEPVTSALIGSGLVGLYFLRRRLPR